MCKSKYILPERAKKEIIGGILVLFTLVCIGLCLLSQLMRDIGTDYTHFWYALGFVSAIGAVILGIFAMIIFIDLPYLSEGVEDIFFKKYLKGNKKDET